MTNIVTMLGGHWPQWYGQLGMEFVYIRIRYGECYIGVGRDHNQAENKSVLVKEDASMEGVTDITDAIEQLRLNGFHIKSIIIPEHVEEVDYPPLTTH